MRPAGRLYRLYQFCSVWGEIHTGNDDHSELCNLREKGDTAVKLNNSSLKELNITKPTVLLDSDKVRRNIARMAAKANETGLSFRPHFKTHQSAQVGTWFREFGVLRGL